ncbi:MAG: hypothetical protein NVS4B11_03680 [Ktedonobacteraceae bacterium]
MAPGSKALIPYAQNLFDVILCSHVLEHIPDDRQAMSELYRILKPGRWALLLVPFDAERAETFEDPNVVDPKERTPLFGRMIMFGRMGVISRIGWSLSALRCARSFMHAS